MTFKTNMRYIIFLLSITTCYAQIDSASIAKAWDRKHNAGIFVDDSNIIITKRFPWMVNLKTPSVNYVPKGVKNVMIIATVSDTSKAWNINMSATEHIPVPPPVPKVWTKSDHTKTGTWVQSTKAAAYNGTIVWSCTVGNSFEYQFEGSGIRWIVERMSTHGKAKIEIDGVDMGEVDTFNSTILHQQQIFEKLGLTNGTHTFKATILNNCIVSDAFEVLK